MNEKAALLSAIRETPDDDTPRLVFADWLQENGEEERAEFVRIQCQLASSKRFRGRITLERRMVELREQEGSKLIVPYFPSLTSIQKGAINKITNVLMLRRGFLEGITIDAASSQTVGLLKTEQPIRHLGLQNESESNVQQLLAKQADLMRTLCSLRVHPHVIRTIAAHTDLFRRLEYLLLSTVEMEEYPEIDEWLLPGAFPQLRRVSFSGSTLTVGQVERLLATAVPLQRVDFTMRTDERAELGEDTIRRLQAMFPKGRLFEGHSRMYSYFGSVKKEDYLLFNGR